MLFISSLSFILSCLLLTLGFLSSFFLVLWVVGQVVYIRACLFFGKACVTVNAPLRTAFAASHRLGMVMFSMSLSQDSFKFPL